MKNNIFYDILDTEIQEIVEEFKQDEYIKKQNENGQKAYAFLIWFLKNYLPKDYIDIRDYKEYIVDGNDDNSCDLIFSNESSGEKIYYIIQAKWFAKTNINNTNEISKEFKACITDFSMILSGTKKESSVNSKFNEKYKELLEHKKNNGKITFIFAALCKAPEDFRISEVEEFNTNDLVKFFLYDIGKIKKLYIDVHYRGFSTQNPLETPYAPLSKINLRIEKSNFIRLLDTADKSSYIFIIDAAMIHELYKNFGNTLFMKNIRNPNKFKNNESIKQTALETPQYFWHYNNGITAITHKVYPFYRDNDLVTVEGLQIINGAQTLKTIYDAYENSKADERAKMQKDLKVTFRLVSSISTEFDLNVTKFTNSQSVIIPRDFYSNDEIQAILYEKFLDDTNIIYERRRGEFAVKRNEGVDLNIVSNEILGQRYLAFYLQKPVYAKSSKKSIFVPQVKGGFYDDIFNNNTHHLDMYVANQIFIYIDNKMKELNRAIRQIPKDNVKEKEALKEIFNNIRYSTYEILALYKVIMEAQDNLWERIRGIVISEFKNDTYKKVEEIYEFIVNNLNDFIKDKAKKDKTLSLSAYFKKQDTYTELSSFITSKLTNKEDSEK